MPNYLVKIILIIAVIAVAVLVFQPRESKNYSQQEMANISAAMNGAIDEAVKKAREQRQAAAAASSTKPKANSGKQSIIGVIYKKEETTWFFKAKDSSERIGLISPSFKNYFVDQLKFDSDQRPILSHIPESMRAANTSSMREATFMLEGVEISVSQLAGQQDVNANVIRWMNQLGLKSSERVILDYRDDKNTVLVMMSQ